MPEEDLDRVMLEQQDVVDIAALRKQVVQLRSALRGALRLLLQRYHMHNLSPEERDIFAAIAEALE